jgi:PAS domain S-box-containing protein
LGQEPTVTSQLTTSDADQQGHTPLRQVLAQQAAVADVAQRALEAHHLPGLLAEACAIVARTLSTELVDVLELSEDAQSLRVVAGVGWKPGVVGELVVPAESGSQSGYTLATGGPVISPDLAREERFPVAQVLRDHNARTGVSVRLGSAESPYGVLAAFTAQPTQFSADDVAFMQAIANLLGSAARRIRAEADLRRSRDEMATIVASVADGILVQGPAGKPLYANDAAARLSGFETAEEFLATPWDQMMSGFELLDDEGQPMPEEDLPSRVTLRTGEPSAASLVRFRIRATGEERWSMVQAAPVLNSDGHVAQVVSVFRDVTEQQRAAAAREVVAETVAALSETLSIDEASRRLAELCVPRLADFCIVDLLETDGSVRTAAIAHVDPACVAHGWRMRELQPVSLDSAAGSGAVIRAGTSELVRLTEEQLRQLLPPGEVLDVLIQLGVRSYVCVPLQGRGRPIGALTMVMADSGRHFDTHDLRLAEEIGSRAGVALENARLYEAAEAGRAELEAIIGAMAEGVLLFDERGELRLSNAAAGLMFGGPAPATMSGLRDAVGSPDDAELEGERRIGASGRWADISVYRARQNARDDRPGGSCVVVLRDVTETRTAQQAREAFIGILSHELRTPITTIYGGSQLLERNLDAARRAEIMSDIRAESERLARLVEDLLVMSRAEGGGFEIGDEPVLVQRVLPALIESLVMRWPTLRVEMRLAERLPAVRGDVTYLEQVLRNLLTNAVRYGEGLDDGIEVVGEERHGQVVVRVLDRGPGPGTTSTERLFELFYRAPAAQRVPGGAGIGLFVCRQLVEAMGGRIWARTRDGGGSEFGFELPIIEAEAVD